MNILYVCTGNVTRSFSAEILSRKQKPEWEFQSAGIRPDAHWQFIFDALEQHGCFARNHIPQKLTKELCKWADVIVCMEDHHLKAVEQLGYKGFLFNELAGEGKTPLHDDTIIPPEQFNMTYLKEFLFDLVDEINEKLPNVFESCNSLKKD